MLGSMWSMSLTYLFSDSDYGIGFEKLYKYLWFVYRWLKGNLASQLLTLIKAILSWRLGAQDASCEWAQEEPWWDVDAVPRGEVPRGREEWHRPTVRSFLNFCSLWHWCWAKLMQPDIARSCTFLYLLFLLLVHDSSSQVQPEGFHEELLRYIATSSIEASS